jgi:hypothetical protein
LIALAKMTAQDLGVVVDFRQQGNSGLFCTAGWAGFEPDERWTIGSESRIAIPSPTAPGSYFLVLKLRPFVAPARLNGQHLSVSVNASVVGEFWVTERTSRVCYLPWRLIDGQRELEITFHTPNAASPAALAVGDDDRVLAVAFSSLALYRDRYAKPDPGPAGVLETNRSSSGDPACMPASDLLSRFESLGQSCEFGLVQRRCQIEPLGFLRFASTPLSHLLEAFDGDFEGLGTPETIKILPSDSGTEYMVSTRYGLFYHAWVKIGEMNPEEIHRRETRRIPILVRKLLQDLQDAEKIFVFRGMGALAEEEVMPLFAAVRRFGPNTLLFVTLADAAHPSGTVELRLPGLLVGYIERFAPSEDAYNLLLDEWIKICRNAYAMRLTTAR